MTLLSNPSFESMCLNMNTKEFCFGIWIRPCHLRCCLVMFLNRTPMFYWCVVWWQSKNKHHEDTWFFRRNWNTIPKFITFSTIANTIRRTYIFSQGINNNALSTNISKQGEIRLLLMLHHKFANATQVSWCVILILIGRSWRTWKTKPNNTHTPYAEASRNMHLFMHQVAWESRCHRQLTWKTAMLYKKN